MLSDSGNRALELPHLQFPDATFQQLLAAVSALFSKRSRARGFVCSEMNHGRHRFVSLRRGGASDRSPTENSRRLFTCVCFSNSLRYFDTRQRAACGRSTSRMIMKTKHLLLSGLHVDAARRTKAVFIRAGQSGLRAGFFSKQRLKNSLKSVDHSPSFGRVGASASLLFSSRKRGRAATTRTLRIHMLAATDSTVGRACVAFPRCAGGRLEVLRQCIKADFSVIPGR